MFKNGDSVRIVSLELEPYFNTSNTFKVVDDKPYKDNNLFVEIENEEDCGIVNVKCLEKIDSPFDEIVLTKIAK